VGVPSPLVGEGQGGGCAANPGGNRLANDRHHAFQFFQHLRIGETQHVVALRRKPCVTATIEPQTLLIVVRFSVKLDDEACSMTGKVRDVTAYRNLSAKTQTIDVMSFQIAPQ
jgi:hypothetical protein